MPSYVRAGIRKCARIRALSTKYRYRMPLYFFILFIFFILFDGTPDGESASGSLQT